MIHSPAHRALHKILLIGCAFYLLAMWVDMPVSNPYGYGALFTFHKLLAIFIFKREFDA